MKRFISQNLEFTRPNLYTDYLYIQSYHLYIQSNHLYIQSYHLYIQSYHITQSNIYDMYVQSLLMCDLRCILMLNSLNEYCTIKTSCVNVAKLIQRIGEMGARFRVCLRLISSIAGGKVHILIEAIYRY